MWGRYLGCVLGMRVGGCVAWVRLARVGLWIKGVRGTCRVVTSGLAQTRAGVVLKKIAVREFFSLSSTATLAHDAQFLRQHVAQD